MSNKKVITVFVHGWSVTNTEIYGELPLRLVKTAKKYQLEIEIKEIFLGRYISFQDEVTIDDISVAFQAAINEQLKPFIEAGERFVCITHSTGGPIVRNWWQRYYASPSSKKRCPMSHLIMLAPANFGSSLVRLGKRQLSRLKSWIEGSEPGTNVLNWLALGSEQAWDLNKQWIRSNGRQIGKNGFFPFILTGQTIDRSLYDFLNSYTGEMGSDGVIRVASANLNARYIRLEQTPDPDEKGECSFALLELIETADAAQIPFRILKGKSHSGETRGIMRSVKNNNSDKKSEQTLAAIIDCICVTNKKEFNQLIKFFKQQTQKVQLQEKVETEKNIFPEDTCFIHDTFTQVIFRVRDNEGRAVEDYDLILTAGDADDPNHLPQGFCVDRQRNPTNREILTYYLNNDVMRGSSAITNEQGEVIRKQIEPTCKLGFKIFPRPDEGYVHYLPCHHEASADILDAVLLPNATVMIDVILQRVVSSNLFGLYHVKNNKIPSGKHGSFREQKPTKKIIF